MKYQVVISSSGNELTQKVNALLPRGWELVGGVSVVHYEREKREEIVGTWVFSQALVKKAG